MVGREMSERSDCISYRSTTGATQDSVWYKIQVFACQKPVYMNLLSLWKMNSSIRCTLVTQTVSKNFILQKSSFYIVSVFVF